jgi:hypothetical protein
MIIPIDDVEECASNIRADDGFAWPLMGPNVMLVRIRLELHNKANAWQGAYIASNRVRVGEHGRLQCP